jgi:ketosteroid isomerase-like protein
VFVIALLRLRGRRSGIWVEHRWAYLFTVRDGKLSRQDSFDDKAQALAAVGKSE